MEGRLPDRVEAPPQPPHQNPQLQAGGHHQSCSQQPRRTEQQRPSSHGSDHRGARQPWMFGRRAREGFCRLYPQTVLY